MAEAGTAAQAEAMGGPEFEAKLDELLEDYRHVVWQSYQLPFFSIMPSLIFLGQYIIAILGIFVEAILLPYTLIALFLRLFKVRWKIIAPFSKRVWFTIVYVSRGEFYGSIVMRPVVRWLVKSHIARRLRILGELVTTSEHFPTETRKRLGAKIAEAQARFPVRELTDFFKDSLIPAVVFGSISFVTDLVGGADEKRLVKLAAYAILGMVVLYGVSIVIAGFPTKRGLLLGRDVKRAAFPGGVSGNGLYGLEREIFSIFPVRPKEMSVDVMFFIFAAAVSPAIAVVASAPGIASQFAANMGLAGSEAVDVAAQMGNYAVIVATYIYIRIRRGVLKRN